MLNLVKILYWIGRTLKQSFTIWKIKLAPLSANALKKLDKPVKQQIEAFIDDLASLDNPRQTGKALQGNLKGLWRYRIGDYRLIAQIKDHELVILVIEVGHRKDIYKS